MTCRWLHLQSQRCFAHDCLEDQIIISGSDVTLFSLLSERTKGQ